MQGKVLFVTELVDTGSSVSRILRELHSMSLDVDIATISGSGESAPKNVHDLCENGKFFSGTKYSSTGLNFYNKDASGVKKNGHSAFLMGYVNSSAERALVVKARKDVEIVADWLYRKYKVKYKTQEDINNEEKFEESRQEVCEFLGRLAEAEFLNNVRLAVADGFEELITSPEVGRHFDSDEDMQIPEKVRAGEKVLGMSNSLLSGNLAKTGQDLGLTLEERLALPEIIFKQQESF